MEKVQKTASEKDPLARAKALIREGKYDVAEIMLSESLATNKTGDAYRNLALIFRARGNTEQAAAFLDEALALDENDDAALALMGELYFDEGDAAQAIGHYVLAIAKNPAQLVYKQRFLELAGSAAFHKYNDMIAGALAACLATPDLDCSRAQILWYTLLTSEPEFKQIYKFSNSGSYVSFNRKPFDKAEDLSPLLSPFFHDGLKKIVVYHPVFEAFLTHLRQRLAEDLAAQKPKFTHDQFTAVAGALSIYAFNVEYIFDTTAEEDAIAAKLRARLETDEAAAKDAAQVALFACYASLDTLKNAARIYDLHKSGPIADTVKLQVAEQSELLSLRDSVTALTEISGGVSGQVRDQYEEFPYPRWKFYSKLLADESVEGVLRGKKSKILVAGCGTGREAIQLAAALPDSSVLAVDLSRMSLAYALKRAKEESVGNITFRQADILKLDASQGPFDYVSSSGVIHHMENPVDGWRVLAGLMKRDGLMRIALYSKTARRHLKTAQDAVKKSGFASDAAGMRQFRRATPQLLDRQVAQDIGNRPDSYHLSMYRDLLFHVQEHCFDIPGIKSALDTLGLDFIKFGLPDSVMAQYLKKFPNDPDGTSLDNWHKFEQENPDAFTHMYHFWCRKKA
ncbi:MAG: methyltransferase domain-containing protein [bacterium]|nr:methyltransferase domain-containing protein [bacterium]